MRRVFSTAMPVVLAGEVRQSKRRRRAAVDGEDFVSGTLCEAICLGAWEPALAVTGCSPPLPSCILSSGPCSSAPSKKRGKARAEIVKMPQGFGCEQVGFMDNFDDCSCCWRSRIARACDRPCKVPPHPSDCRTKHLTTLQNSVVAVKIG